MPGKQKGIAKRQVFIPAALILGRLELLLTETSPSLLDVGKLNKIFQAPRVDFHSRITGRGQQEEVLEVLDSRLSSLVTQFC